MTDPLDILNSFTEWSPDKEGSSCPIDTKLENKEWLKKLAALCDKIADYENALREIRDDFDCDNDAHRYNTTCRCCFAKKVLDKHKGK